MLRHVWALSQSNHSIWISVVIIQHTLLPSQKSLVETFFVSEKYVRHNNDAGYKRYQIIRDNQKKNQVTKNEFYEKYNLNREKGA